MIDDQLVNLLRPLKQVVPVTRPLTGKRRHRLPLLAVVAVILAVGSAARYAIYDSTQSTSARVVPSHLPRWMSCLVGGRADQAQALLTGRGYAISWRFERYTSKTLGYASTPKSVPKNSVVEDLILEAHTAIVFVRARDDRNAPPITTRCP